MSLRRSLMTLSSLPFLFVAVALVSGDFATYQDFGKHALCMQDWKKATKITLANLKNDADSTLSNTQALNDTLQAAVGELETQFLALNTSVHGLLETLGTASAASGGGGFQTPMSAFQTYISAAGGTSSGDTALPIKYTDEVLDENDDHDTTTGLFTCPKLGLYWFHATLTGSGRNVVYFKVTRVDTEETENIAYMKYNYGQETSATAMAVLYPGDTVGIYPTDANAFSLVGGSANTFAGYLLADYDDPNYTPASTTPAPTTATTTAAAATPTTQAATATATPTPAAATTPAPTTAATATTAAPTTATTSPP